MTSTLLLMTPVDDILGSSMVLFKVNLSSFVVERSMFVFAELALYIVGAVHCCLQDFLHIADVSLSSFFLRI